MSCRVFKKLLLASINYHFRVSIYCGHWLRGLYFTHGCRFCGGYDAADAYVQELSLLKKEYELIP